MRHTNRTWVSFSLNWLCQNQYGLHRVTTKYFLLSPCKCLQLTSQRERMGGKITTKKPASSLSALPSFSTSSERLFEAPRAWKIPQVSRQLARMVFGTCEQLLSSKCVFITHSWPPVKVDSNYTLALEPFQNDVQESVCLQRYLLSWKLHLCASEPGPDLFCPSQKPINWSKNKSVHLTETQVQERIFTEKQPLIAAASFPPINPLTELGFSQHMDTLCLGSTWWWPKSKLCTSGELYSAHRMLCSSQKA